MEIIDKNEAKIRTGRCSYVCHAETPFLQGTIGMRNKKHETREKNGGGNHGKGNHSKQNETRVKKG